MKGNDCCLSGGENLCIKLLREGKEPAYIAAFCLEYVKAALDQMCRGLLERYGSCRLCLRVGVMVELNLAGIFFETIRRNVCRAPIFFG